MKFAVDKEVILNGLRIVERATVAKGLQPVLANILIESVSNDTLKLSATSFDLTVVTYINCQVEKEGKITLPAKRLSDIISRLGNAPVNFEINENNIAIITSGKSKFDIIGISASEFPQIEDGITEYCESIEIEMKPFITCAKMTNFAAAGYETNNLLSGVICSINNNILEMASTDGNRLARAKEFVKNDENKDFSMIVPSKVLSEFIKMTSYVEDENVVISREGSKIIFQTGSTKLISRLMDGQYPKYNQLIPTSFAKQALVNREKLISALEIVSTMINERTSIVKFEFSDGVLKLNADTPDAGASEDKIEISYSGEDMLIAFNYRYLLDFLKIAEVEEVLIQMNTNLSAAVIRPKSEEDYLYLIMPVQIRV